MHLGWEGQDFHVYTCMEHVLGAQQMVPLSCKSEYLQLNIWFTFHFKLEVLKGKLAESTFHWEGSPLQTLLQPFLERLQDQRCDCELVKRDCHHNGKRWDVFWESGGKFLSLYCSLFYIFLCMCSVLLTLSTKQDNNCFHVVSCSTTKTKTEKTMKILHRIFSLYASWCFVEYCNKLHVAKEHVCAYL